MRAQQGSPKETPSTGFAAVNTSPNTLVIATSNPNLLAPLGAGKGGSNVKFASSSEEAFALLKKSNSAALLADFDPLDDHWTGQRILRHIRLDDSFAHVPVYLMAETWSDHQAVWSTRLGAAGLVERSPAAVGAFVMGRAPRLSESMKQSLSDVDEAFRQHAGPLTATHLADARLAIESHSIELTFEAYAQFLGERLRHEGSRKAFFKRVGLAAAQATVRMRKQTKIAGPADTWISAIEALFVEHVGALPAKAELPSMRRKLSNLLKKGPVMRQAYQEVLAEGISDVEKRTEFLTQSLDLG